MTPGLGAPRRTSPGAHGTQAGAGHRCVHDRTCREHSLAVARTAQPGSPTPRSRPPSTERDHVDRGTSRRTRPGATVRGVRVHARRRERDQPAPESRSVLRGVSRLPGRTVIAERERAVGPVTVEVQWDGPCGPMRLRDSHAERTSDPARPGKVAPRLRNRFASATRGCRRAFGVHCEHTRHGSRRSKASRAGAGHEGCSIHDRPCRDHHREVRTREAARSPESRSVLTARSRTAGRSCWPEPAPRAPGSAPPRHETRTPPREHGPAAATARSSRALPGSPWPHQRTGTPATDTTGTARITAPPPRSPPAWSRRGRP